MKRPIWSDPSDVSDPSDPSDVQNAYEIAAGLVFGSWWFTGLVWAVLWWETARFKLACARAARPLSGPLDQISRRSPS